jgi:hypothetical protein
MGDIEKLVEEVRESLKYVLPSLRKTVLKKLPIAVAAMIQARTPNTLELSCHLPLPTKRSDMREQWLRRLLKNPLIESEELLAPFMEHALEQVAAAGQTILLSMDQTHVDKHFAILMLSIRCGDRALPVAWKIETGQANLGFNKQKSLLEQIRAKLPENASVMLLADRFYPSAALFKWLKGAGWQYRVRLKGNLSVRVDDSSVLTTADLAQGTHERYETNAALFSTALPIAIGVLHEPNHPEPWIIAMDCLPTRAAVLDYGKRWAIEPMFSDFKSRGFDLQKTQLKDPKRLDCLLLIMALAMYWCVWVGRENALNHPSPTEKKPKHKPIQNIGVFVKPLAAHFRGLNAVCAY